MQALLETVRVQQGSSAPAAGAASRGWGWQRGGRRWAASARALLAPPTRPAPLTSAAQASRPADLAEQTRLQTQAFEAINEVVRASAADTTPMVVQLIPLVVQKLQETLHMGSGGGAEAAERQSEIQVGGGGGAVRERAGGVGGSHGARQAALVCFTRAHVPPPPPLGVQGLLCGMTQVIVQKLSDSDTAKAGVLQVGVQRGKTVCCAADGVRCCGSGGGASRPHSSHRDPLT